jgi:hypothetical protein
MMERYRLPIPWDAVPISHTPPYRRFDPSVPQGYPKVITAEDVAQDGGRYPDPRKYRQENYDTGRLWVLREEFR